MFQAVKGVTRQPVTISSSIGVNDATHTNHEADYDQIIRHDDPDWVIHLPTKRNESPLAQSRLLDHCLDDLGIGVSTGRVVDFRVKEFIRTQPDKHTIPLVYPSHFGPGVVDWPKLNGKKPNGLVLNPKTEALAMPTGYYLLVRRFSFKEQRRRLVVAIYDPERVPSSLVGFENHLNVFHMHGAGLQSELAMGLAVYLSSTLVDTILRQFNGHTQINASDLRMLSYPSIEVLGSLGRRAGNHLPSQEEIDAIVERTLLPGGPAASLELIRA